MHRNGPAFILLILSLLAATAVGQERGGRRGARRFPPPRQVDLRRAELVGVRRIASEHLVLYTDLLASDAVDQLPRVFDAAVPQWAEYFGVQQERIENWRMQAYLIKDVEKFVVLELMPRENPQFNNGYCSGYEMWWYEQPSDFYRRQLMLHEGTHGFMLTQLGDAGPGWYMEGTAELLGTHSWDGSTLVLRHLPESREAARRWGRIRLLRDAYHDDKVLPLDAVLAMDNRRPLSTTEYAWSWALSTLLDSHPRYGEKFRQLPRFLGDRRFTREFREYFQQEWPDIVVDWHAFIATVDYGYDTQRMTVEHKPAAPVRRNLETEIAADRGWQSTGWVLEADQTYRISASGRYRIAEDTQPWMSEPGGVTIRYVAGQPLGMLLGAFRTATTGPPSPDSAADDRGLAQPFPVSLQTALTPARDVILYLRVNDSSAELSDNAGAVQVKIAPQASGD